MVIEYREETEVWITRDPPPMPDPPESHPEDGSLKKYYEESIEDGLGYIQSVNSENKVFQRIRETHQDDWQVVELCREILFENSKLINHLKEGIENDRQEIKKLSRV